MNDLFEPSAAQAATASAAAPTPRMGRQDGAPASAPASALGTCGTCGHGSKGRFNMIACDQVTWPVSVNNPALPCPIGRWIELTPEILSRRAAQAGIDQAAAAADRAREGWSEVAFEYVKRFAAEHPKPAKYIGHDIVQASIAAAVPQPPNSRAWGSPIQRAGREGVIRKVGYTEDTNSQRHLSPVPQYETA